MKDTNREVTKRNIQLNYVWKCSNEGLQSLTVVIDREREQEKKTPAAKISRLFQGGPHRRSQYFASLRELNSSTWTNYESYNHNNHYSGQDLEPSDGANSPTASSTPMPLKSFLEQREK
jgi:hypothetical protein